MSRPRIADIVALAAEMTVIDPAVILGRRRFQRIVRVRQACMAVAREAGHSFPTIGKRFSRDHSTVVHAVAKVDIIAERDQSYAAFVDRLRRASKLAKPLVSERVQPVVLAQTPMPEPDFETELEPDPIDYNLSDDELLSRAVAKHYANARRAA